MKQGAAEVDCETMPQSSTPDINVCVKDIPDENAAKRLGYAVLSAVKIIGRTLELNDLDGITIAVDYDSALAALDRGIDDETPESRTNDSNLVGIAKSVIVKRGEKFKTHLLFSASPIFAISSEDPDKAEFALALAVIAHECAHVEEHTRRNRHFPGSLFCNDVGLVLIYLRYFSETFWGGMRFAEGLRPLRPARQRHSARG